MGGAKAALRHCHAGSMERSTMCLRPGLRGGMPIASWPVHHFPGRQIDFTGCGDA